MKKKFFGVSCFFIFLSLGYFLHAQAGVTALDEFARAFDLFKKGDFQRAGAAFLSLYQAYPNETIAADSCFMAAQAYFNAGDYRTSYRYSEEFIHSYPGHPNIPDMEFQRGRILFKMGLFKEASAALGAFIDKYPQNALCPSALFWEAESFYQLGDIAKAVPLFSEIKEKWSDSDKASLAAWRLNVIGLEAREAMYLRLAAFETEKKSSKEIEEMQKEPYREQQYLRYYFLLKSRRTRSSSSEATVAQNEKLNILLDAKKRALDLLISLINASLMGVAP